jgi:8-oxo-dGTP diphosphatase
MGQPIFYGSVHLLFFRGDEILLSQRQNTGFEDGNWSVVAGKIDGGEEVVAAAIREAYEEAGVTIKPSDVMVSGVMHRNNTNSEWIDFYVKVDKWEGTITNRELDKCAGLKWFKLDALPDNTVPYIRKAIENHCANIWFDSIGWASAAR